MHVSDCQVVFAFAFSPLWAHRLAFALALPWFVGREVDLFAGVKLIRPPEAVVADVVQGIVEVCAIVDAHGYSLQQRLSASMITRRLGGFLRFSTGGRRGTFHRSHGGLPMVLGGFDFFVGC